MSDDIIESEEVCCPYCGTELDTEDILDCITYWGDEGKKEVACPECGEDFYVNEFVARTFECSKKKDDE